MYSKWISCVKEDDRNRHLNMTRLLLCVCVFSGERPDPEQIFKLTSLQSFSGGSGGGAPSFPMSPAHTPSHNTTHRQIDSVLMETPQDTLVRHMYAPVPYARVGSQESA